MKVSLDWVKKGADGYYATVSYNDSPTEFHVAMDGSFTGITSRWNQNTRNSTPEIILQGKSMSAEKDISFIDGYVRSRLSSNDTFENTDFSKIKKTRKSTKKTETPVETPVVETPAVEETTEVPAEPEVITESTEVVEEPVVKSVEEVTEPVVEESIPETLVEENVGDPNDLSSAEETDVVKDENPIESKISFIVDKNTMSIRSSIEGVIKYTTNGKDVNISSKIYREPFSLEGVETVKVKVFDAEKNVLCEDIWVNSTN